jgi:hypothetical protein
MSFTFAYKIGHNQDLSLAEYTALTHDTEYKLFGGFIYCNKNLELNKVGSLVYKAKVLKELPETLPKKMGFVNMDSDKNVIGMLKERGAKKILLQNKYPNAGHFKYVKNWFIHKKLENKSIYLEILEHQDADNWTKLDMDLPEKDMKRGIINLKLALSMYNLIQDKTPNVCDPFAGLGRNAVAIWDLDKNFYLSDLDEKCIPQIKKNLDWLQQKVESNSKVVEIKVLNAQDLQAPTSEDFVICTEGYLTPVLNDAIHLMEANQRLDQVTSFWDKTLTNWAKIENLKEIVFCLPYYLLGVKKMFIHPQEIIPYGFELVEDPIFYDRAKSKVGHQIIHLKRV